MNDYPSGKPLTATLIGSTAAAVELTFLDENGVTYTFAARDRVVIRSVVLSGVAANTVILFQDHNGNNVKDSGEDVIPLVLSTSLTTVAAEFSGGLPLRAVNAALTNILSVSNGAAAAINLLVVCEVFPD